MRLLALFNLSQAILIHFLVKNNILLAVDSDEKDEKDEKNNRLQDDLNKFVNSLVSY